MRRFGPRFSGAVEDNDRCRPATPGPSPVTTSAPVRGRNGYVRSARATIALYPSPRPILTVEDDLKNHDEKFLGMMEQLAERKRLWRIWWSEVSMSDFWT
ncbi:hypothetical protein BT96DRAFT_428208 [Gymnopus androsaceus JB14]|uniref:Uncharacterized protein n=1 Tax=Gymnopus androsaceus JB14 TaxID=1447944 RepID=A0A6A4GSE9_9AGAR|nr:hypothetical protein BT96DRAFT_428208 [Gymnopus androsaceus JB14]